MPVSAINPLDLRIINALQIRPRAPWAQLAPILGADAATLNRRWRALRERGTAWMTTVDASKWRAAALVEISCHSGASLRLAAALAEAPEVIAVDLTAGGRDIVATVAASSEAALGTYLLEDLAKIPDILSVKSHPMARTITDGRSWRLRALDQHEAASVSGLPKQGRGRPAARNAEIEQAILAQLNIDGRASVTKIGAALGESPRHIRDLLGAMAASGGLIQRTDIARSASDWPVSAWYFLRVPASKLDDAATRLGNLGEVRLVSHTIGPYDLIMDVWLKTLTAIQHLEQQLELKLSDVSTADRSLVLRSVKQLGQILDEQGRSTGRSRI